MLSHLLSPVACSWELFAQQIGVPVAQLSQIKVANPQTGPNYIYKCFTQVLEWWVANHENPVYETMIDALDPGPGNTSPVMNRALARELREFMAKQRGEVHKMISMIKQLAEEQDYYCPLMFLHISVRAVNPMHSY